MKNRIAIIFLAVIFGWLMGHLHAFVQRTHSSIEERMVLDQVEQTMNERRPFRFLGQWKFYPTPNGYQVVSMSSSDTKVSGQK